MSSTLPSEAQPEGDCWSERNELLTRLIARSRCGDSAAFEQLYDATAGWLLARIRRTVPYDEAEDVLAEVFLKVWRQLDAYDAARSAPGVWLAVIARSTSADHLRKNRGRSGQEPVGDGEPGGAGSLHWDGPEQLLSRLQDQALVHACIASLNDAERLVVGLAYFQECTHQEIASRTGLPLGAVKALARSARSKLRSALQDRSGHRGSTIEFDLSRGLSPTQHADRSGQRSTGPGA